MVTNCGEGGGGGRTTKREGGGRKGKFPPYINRWGEGGEFLAILKRGGGGCTTSFGIVLTQVHTYCGGWGHKRVYPVSSGGGGGGGPAISYFCSPPTPYLMTSHLEQVAE